MRAYIFGAGRYGREVAAQIISEGTAEVIGFLDNYAKDAKLEWNGYCVNIYKPSQVINTMFDQIILALDWVDEAIKQLLELNVDFYKINTTYIINKGLGARDIFLQHFAQEIYRNGIEGSVAEAGVFKGAFSEKISAAFPDRKLYLFDTFEGFDERDIIEETEKAKNGLDKSDYFNETSVDYVLRRIPNPQNVIIKKGYIPETLLGVDDRFCFVNLDLDLYKPTINALDFFWDKVNKGGGILIHDYYNEFSFPNLKKGVIEFSEKEGICFFPIGDGLSVFLPKI